MLKQRQSVIDCLEAPALSDHTFDARFLHIDIYFILSHILFSPNQETQSFQTKNIFVDFLVIMIAALIDVKMVCSKTTFKLALGRLFHTIL